jgi:cytochrome c oxidase assembly protein subunit 15
VTSRQRRTLSPEAYRRITLAALWLLGLIVVTGAGVRLSGSGLGCTDWPTCSDHRVVAEWSLHPMIEFVNRTITGLVSAAVVLAVLGSMRRTPRRRDLLWLSWGLVLVVIAQIVLGGIVVKSHLNPWLVQGHFVLSMLLVLDAVVLCHRAGLPDPPAERPVVTPALLRWGWAMVGLAACVIVTGTIVTGAGPHSGTNRADLRVRRLPVSAHDAARIHGLAMIAFLAATVWVLVQLQRHGAPQRLRNTGMRLLTVLLLQAAIGYTQYFTGVPPLLVLLHVLGATLVWINVLWFALGMKQPLSPDGSGPRESPHESDRADDLSRRDVINGS